MPELALKIGDGAGEANKVYFDGDIVDAFNAHRISRNHAQAICHPIQTGLTGDDLRPTGGLAQMYLERTAQYRFETVSRTEVRRTEIATSTPALFGPTPNAFGESIQLRTYLARRLAHLRHRIFGEPTREIWYGGRTDTSVATIADVWVQIEAMSAHREVDNRLWPFGGEEPKSYLIVPVDDFDDATLNELKAPLTKLVDKVPVVVKRRKHHVNWRTDLGLSLAERTDVLDASKAVDLRASKTPFDRATITQTKTVLTP